MRQQQGGGGGSRRRTTGRRVPDLATKSGSWLPCRPQSFAEGHQQLAAL
jgi:hypothetical protein